MSKLQRYRLIEDTPRTGLARLIDSIRSYWIGPVSTGSPDFERLFSSPPSRAGVVVTEQTALTYSAFWACVNAISTDVASLPLIHYKRASGGGKERYVDSKLYRLLHDEPNPEMTSITFRQTLTGHALSWGNGYAEIERDGQMRPLYLWPLTPGRVAPYRDASGTIAYLVRRAGGGEDTVAAANMLHIPGLGFDGVTGYSVVAMARDSIGLSLAMERFGSTFFGNGATFGGVISYKGPRPPELAEKSYKETLELRHQGVERAHKLLALYNDATYTRMGIPPNDAQFLESRTFQIEETCRWFRMAPHKIQHLLRSTFSNIEHQAIEHTTDTIRPWTVRWEQECNRKLISPSERRIQFIEHLFEGVLRGDLASRYAAYAVGRQWGWLSADDVREKENLNPLPNKAGTIYLVPTNMAPADRIGELIDAQIAAKKTPPPSGTADPNAGDPSAARDALAMVETIRAALTETQQKAEAHLARALTAEAAAVQATDGGAVLRVEADTERAAALELAREVGTLKALLLEATEREAHERAEREAAETDALAARTAEEAARRHAEAVQTAKAAEVNAARVVLVEREQALREAETRLDERDGWLPPADVASDKAAILAAHEVALAQLMADVDARERERDTARTAVHQAELQAALEASAHARAEVDAAILAERTAAQDRDAGMIAAHRALIVDAMGRMIRRETEKARRAQATPEKLRSWLETFYPVHAEICQAALLPAIRTHLAWQSSEDDPDDVTAAFVSTHIADSIRQIRAVLDSDGEEYAQTLESTLRRWELDRADAVADVILQQEIDHVRRR